MPAAARDPNVKARMMSAATMPIVSLRRDLVAESWTPRAPPASTWMRALRAGSAAAKTWAASAVVSWPPFTLMSTCATAVLPSALTKVLPAGEKGLITLATWGARPTLPRAATTALLLAGSVSLPRETWKTSGLWPFCCGANSRRSRSDAFWAPVPGSLMSLFVRAPKTSTPVATAATTSTHSVNTTYLRRAQRAPRRWRRLDTATGASPCGHITGATANPPGDRRDPGLCRRQSLVPRVLWPTAPTSHGGRRRPPDHVAPPWPCEVAAPLPEAAALDPLHERPVARPERGSPLITSPCRRHSLPTTR